MSTLTLYCPTCGEELVKKHDDIANYDLWKCKKCHYILTNPNTIDISFKSKGIAKALSNLCPYPFQFEGINCSCMEAFIQSLKVQDIAVQEDVCFKTGLFCYNIRYMFDDWRKTGTVYWKGKPINRQSKDYLMLITRAYEALLNQSPIFHYALSKVKENGYMLKHSIGCEEISETLLTPNEFTAILDYLIKKHL